jgi:hypothetical protein
MTTAIEPRNLEVLTGVPRRIVQFDEYRRTACDADVLLFEPSGCWLEWFGGSLIAHGTDGPFDHAAAVVRLEDNDAGRVWVSEYNIPCPHLVPLSAKVRDAPGKISVFRYRGLTAELREKIAYRLRDDLGGSYRYRNLGLIALGQLALVRWLFWFVPGLRAWRSRMIAQQSRKQTYGICSQHVARSFKFGAGIELVRKPLSEVSPNDLGRCAALEYVGTLAWPDDWAIDD